LTDWKSVSRSTLEYSGTVFTGLFTPIRPGSCLALTTNTMLTIGLSHLLGRGVRLETHEAVALARELLAHACGIPTPDNIQLGSDGSASCISANGRPSVASVADLLLTLLPAGTPNLPAPLRYAIARGLEAVEAPPFASLGEFSSALQRFEKGASRDVLKSVLQRGARPSRPIAAPIAVAQTPVTPPAAGPSPAVPRPTVVPPRPTLVVRKSGASSSGPPQPIVAPPPMFRSFGVDREAGSPVHSSRRWAVVAPAALAASFAVGFAIGDGITDRRAATKPSGSARVSRGLSAAPANDSAANPPQVKLREEIVRVPRTPAVAREIVPSPAAAGTDASADAPSGPVDHAGEPVRAIHVVRATNRNAFSPAFASDGTAIFFHTGRERDARSAIEVATAGSQTSGDLGLMTIVDDGSRNYHAQPSPDGRFVAFDSDRDGERGIYVANRDGSQIRRVSGAGYAAVPTWSRNNEWLAYIRAEADQPSVWNLWVQPAAGGGARRVTNYRYGQTWAASWFPDHRRIAYSHEDTLMVMDLQTGEATRYRTPVKGQLVRTPAVSPDGTQIIFQVFRHGAWLLDLADGSMQRVLTDPTAEEFAWSPDGRGVAFHSRRAGPWRIYVLSRS
jgi:WD40 repeat protein